MVRVNTLLRIARPSTICCVWSVESSDRALIAHQVGFFPEVGILGIRMELTLDVPECSGIQRLSLLCSE